MQIAMAEPDHDLSERLIRAISRWRHPNFQDDDIGQLLTDGADVNGMCGTLRPLHCCCMVADNHSLSLLLDKGAKIDEVDGYGRAALHYAAEKDARCVSVLLASGAKVDTRDAGGDTALHWAVFCDNVACVRRLLRHGADVDAADYLGNTPLSWGVTRGSQNCVKVLLEYNADVETAMPTQGIAATLLPLLVTIKKQPDGRFPAPAFPTQPCALRGLCRFVIRRCLGPCYLPAVVPSLPLPPPLHRYLLLR